MRSDRKSHPLICAIVAMSLNRVIGVNNQLPWHLPADLKHFKELTTGFPVIMGRKTYESIGKPLPNRLNIVLTRDPVFTASDVLVSHSLDAALNQPAIAEAEKIFIIGGAALYKEALPRIQHLYMTVVNVAIHGDAYFPELLPEYWRKISESEHLADKKNIYSYTFIEWEAIAST